MAARPAKAASWAAVLGFIAALVCLAPAATAVDRYWTDGSGQWDVGDNWTPSGQPQVGDNVYLTQSDATDRTVTYYNTTNPDAVLNSLTIDATGLGTMALDMPNDHALSVTTEYVGYDGQGAVTQSAGTHTAAALYLGYHAAGEGTYTVTGGTLSSSNGQYVGCSGAGTLNIEAGGQVSSSWSEGFLGYWPGSTGIATVTGAGSTWTNSSNLHVGSGYSTGTLNIEAGGQVSNSSGFLGYWSGSTGIATVTGADSTWTNSSDLYVGGYGTGTLTVTDGGLVSAGTLLASPSNLLGNGTMTAQGAVLDADLVFDSTHGLTQALAFGTGGTLNLNVDGTGGLGVGYKGTGTLRIADGRTVASLFGYLGYWSGSTGTATVDGIVDGIGATWTNSNELYVGRDGTGTLDILNGGQVSNSLYGCLGDSRESSGTATVDGIGSTWTNSNELYVGREGTGTLTIQNGGQVSNTWGYLGLDSGSNGTATVDGSGSTWTNGGELYVGYEGTGTLTIRNGGQVSNTCAYLGTSGTATVDGIGSTWTNSNELYVGRGGTGTLTIQNGGQVSSTNGYLGYSSSSSGTASVDGSGSTWSSPEALTIGASGTGTLSIRNGGQVSSAGGWLGSRTGSSGTATVDGIGSTWTNSNELYVGREGTGTLTIQNGGQVSSAYGFLGYVSGFGSSPGSTGTATVTGAGSTWTNSSGLFVGYHGGAGTLNIEAGGQVSNTEGCLGYEWDSTGTATVSGAGSTWTNSSGLFVGYHGGAGTLNIEAGGQVSSSSGYLGYGYEWDSTGTATVSGAGSTWINSSDLYVGYEEGTGTLNIEAGGQVGNTSGYLGYAAGSTGTATVTGTDSTWTNSGDLYVGGSSSAAGGSGSVTVQDGGRLTVDGTLKLWRYSSSRLGKLTVQTGGIVIVGVLDTSSGGTLVWTDGTLGIAGASGLTIGAGGPLGRSLALSAAKNLNVTNALTIARDASVALSGGSLAVGTLANLGTLNWTSGTVAITGEGGLTVGPSGPLGASVTLDAGKILSVTNTATTAPGATLTVDGGAFSADTLDNAGTLLIRAADTTDFTGAIANSGSVELAVPGGTWTFDEALGGAGTFVKSGDGTLVIAGPQNYDPGALFDVLGGALVLDTDAGSLGADLSISVADAELYFGANQHLDTLSIGDGGRVVFSGAQVVVLEHLVIGGMDLGATTLTPEPATLGLLALGGLGVLLRRKRK